ncbi:hypothetical protein NEDG_01421 [Nematocida displodere]|uniref:Uncharacterized protein n=1 Tax=Nematocida displodere TaxID=1805483 RepID=A0A177EC03_9MICR|nr:hypothetical protein NEDG_01421 [Nematocida displodere]
MADSGVAQISSVPVSEDLLREKVFAEAATRFTDLLTATSIQIPLIIHPGRRVKSKKEMREMEQPVVEARKPLKVNRAKPSKRDRRKKDQVQEKIQNLMVTAKANGKPGDRESKKPGKRDAGGKYKSRDNKSFTRQKQRPGKAKRQKRSSK